MKTRLRTFSIDDIDFYCYEYVMNRIIPTYQYSKHKSVTSDVIDQCCSVLDSMHPFSIMKESIFFMMDRCNNQSDNYFFED